MGKYSDRVSAQNRNLSPVQVRSNKCLRSKNRNTERKMARREIVESSHVEWRKKSPQQQIEALDIRLGRGFGAQKQRKRICEKAGIEYVEAKPVSFSQFVSESISGE